MQKKVDTYAAVGYINTELASLYRTRNGSSLFVRRRNSLQAQHHLERIDEGHRSAMSPDDLERMKRSYTEYSNYGNISVTMPSLPKRKSEPYEP